MMARVFLHCKVSNQLSMPDTLKPASRLDSEISKLIPNLFAEVLFRL